MSSSNIKPSPLAPREEKLKDEYGVRFGKYIQSKTIGSDFEYYRKRRDRIREARAYAQGDQSNQRYKQIYNATGDSSPMNLDWTPLGIGSKFVSSLVSDILGEFNFEVKAIDPASMSKRKDEKERVLANFYDKDFIVEMKESTGVDLSENSFIPETLEEVELHMGINYKQSVEIAMKQIISYNLHLSDYPDEIRESVITDLIVAGIGAVKVYFDPSYGIKIRYVDVENFVFSESSKQNMQDPQWAGEMRWMSIGDIRRISKNKFSEEELTKIYETHKGRWGNDTFYNDYYSNYNNSNNPQIDGYFYDTLVVPVLDFCFKTEDRDKIKVTKSKAGERRYLKKDTYQPKEGSKNVSVEEEVYECVYEGMYILGTEHIFNYGLMKNMVRPEGSLTEVELPYKVYAPKFYNMTNKSLMELIKPNIDAINIAHLKLQNTVARSHPEITVIDIEGWLDIAMGGKDWSPLELQDIFDSTGIVYTKSRGKNGEFIPDPVKSFPNKVNIDPYISMIEYEMKLIRELLGFTPEREGVTQNKQLVGTMELSIGASRNATKFIENALNNITKRVCKDIAWRVQDIPKTSKFWKTYEEAIGAADMAIIDSMDDIPMANFGIFISTLPSQEERIALQTDIEREITQGNLRGEDAMMIRKLARTAGVDTAYQYMTVKRKKYAEEKMQMEQGLKEQETQRQLQMQQMAAQAKQMEQQGQAQLTQVEEQAQAQREISVLQEKYRLEMILAERKFQYDSILKGAEDSGQMAKEAFKEDRKDDRVKMQAKLTAKQQEQVSKVKSGEKPQVDTEEIETGETQLEDLL